MNKLGFSVSMIFKYKVANKNKKIKICFECHQQSQGDNYSYFYLSKRAVLSNSFVAVKRLLYSDYQSKNINFLDQGVYKFAFTVTTTT